MSHKIIASQAVENLMREHGVNGLSLYRMMSEQALYVKHFDITKQTVNEDSLFNACSITKLATALLSIRLVEEGFLFLDHDVNAQLKHWKVPQTSLTESSPVTLRALLCHQGGFMDPPESFGHFDFKCDRPKIIDILEGKTPYCKVPAQVSYRPFTKCEYSDMGYCIIEELITEVTGMPFDKAIEKWLLRPLEMKNSVMIVHPEEMVPQMLTGYDPLGIALNMSDSIYPFSAAAGLWSTSTDLSKLFVEIARGLKGHSKLGIKQTLIEEMISPQGSSEWSGLGVFIDKVDNQLEICSLGWGSGFQCILVGYPHDFSCSVIMTNQNSGVHQLSGIIGRLLSLL